MQLDEINLIQASLLVLLTIIAVDCRPWCAPISTWTLTLLARSSNHQWRCLHFSKILYEKLSFAFIFISFLLIRSLFFFPLFTCACINKPDLSEAEHKSINVFTINNNYCWNFSSFAFSPHSLHASSSRKLHIITKSIWCDGGKKNERRWKSSRSALFFFHPLHFSLEWHENCMRSESCWCFYEEAGKTCLHILSIDSNVDGSWRTKKENILERTSEVEPN